MQDPTDDYELLKMHSLISPSTVCGEWLLGMERKREKIDCSKFQGFRFHPTSNPFKSNRLECRHGLCIQWPHIGNKQKILKNPKMTYSNTNSFQYYRISNMRQHNRIQTIPKTGHHYATICMLHTHAIHDEKKWETKKNTNVACTQTARQTSNTQTHAQTHKHHHTGVIHQSNGEPFHLNVHIHSFHSIPFHSIPFRFSAIVFDFQTTERRKEES